MYAFWVCKPVKLVYQNQYQFLLRKVSQALIRTIVLVVFQLLTVDAVACNEEADDEAGTHVLEDEVDAADDEHESEATQPLFFLDTKADTNITKQLNVWILLE